MHSNLPLAATSWQLCPVITRVRSVFDSETSACIVHEILNRVHRNRMHTSKFLQAFAPHHRTIIIDEFANDCNWISANQLRHCNACLGVTTTRTQTIRISYQRKYMARSGKITPLRCRVSENIDGLCTLLRTDSGSQSIECINRNCKCSSLLILIALHHCWQVEAICNLLRNRCADNARGVTDHKAQCLRRCAFSKQHQIALILARFIIGDDHKLAEFKFG